MSPTARESVLTSVACFEVLGDYDAEVVKRAVRLQDCICNTLHIRLGSDTAASLDKVLLVRVFRDDLTTCYAFRRGRKWMASRRR